jgi:sodium/proline symporter
VTEKNPETRQDGHTNVDTLLADRPAGRHGARGYRPQPQELEQTSMTVTIVFAIYLAGMAGIGIYCSRFNKDMGDFVLGGRRLGAWVAAFSAQASDFSGWLLVALPAAAYAGGFSMVWTCAGCSLGVMFNWMVLAPRIRKQAEQYDALTVPDYLESRFNDKTRIIRIVSVLTILVFYSAYIAAQFIAAGEVFHSAFAQEGLPWGETETWTYYHQGLVIGMVVILGYTALGGFMAVCWTDFVQAILMVSALVAIPIIGVVQLGGFNELFIAMQDKAATDVLSVDGGKAGASFVFGVVLSGLAWGVGYPGQPHIVARYMAIEDPAKIAKSSLISIIWSLFALYGSMFVGFVALAILDQDLIAEGIENRAMPLLALELLPPVLAGVALSAAVAAIMSTVDSQIIVAVAAVVHDGYEKLFNGHPSGRTAVWLSRCVVIALGVGGVAMAWERQKIFGVVLDAWGGLAAGLGPALVLGCVWRGTSRVGVIVGMVTGVLVTQFWPQIMAAFTSAGGALAECVPHLESISLIICVGLNLLLVITISLLSRLAPESPTEPRP